MPCNLPEKSGLRTTGTLHGCWARDNKIAAKIAVIAKSIARDQKGPWDSVVDVMG